MAVILSDTFNSATVDAEINGRTLDNGLGGSGTRTWSRQTGILATPEGNGAGGVRQITNPTEQAGVSLGANTNGKARIKFRTSNLAVNFIVFGKSDVAGHTGVGTGSVCARLGASTTTLSIRNQANTVLATLGIAALSTATDYWLELEINGNDVVARVLNSDLSVRNNQGHTYSSGAPTGNYWGFGTDQGSNNGWVADDFLMQDLGGGGGPPPGWWLSRKMNGGFDSLAGGF